jgi:hypothetical protein
LRHGLARTLPKSDRINPDAQQLASAIAGPNSDPCRFYFALMAAEAEIELRKLQAIRLCHLEPPDKDLTSALSILPRLERYERRLVSRRNRALRLL